MHTDLVIPYRPAGKPQGLEVYAGKPLYGNNDSSECCGKCIGSHTEYDESHQWPVCCCIYNSGSYSSTCTCYQFPAALFGVSHKVSELAHEVVFSENRLILRGDTYYSGVWLRSKPQHLLSQIRRLDVMVGEAYFYRWRMRVVPTGFPGKVSAALDGIASALDDQLSLRNLTLSIDAGFTYPQIREDIERTSYYARLKESYQRLIAPFASRPRFRELRAFFVFWPLYGSMETEAEKLVMGDDYNSRSHGKIPYKDRDYRFPHGWEWCEEDKNGFNDNLMDYQPGNMFDIE